MNILRSLFSIEMQKARLPIKDDDVSFQGLHFLRCMQSFDWYITLINRPHTVNLCFRYVCLYDPTNVLMYINTQETEMPHTVSVSFTPLNIQAILESIYS